MTEQERTNEQLKLEYELIKVLQGKPLNTAFCALEQAKNFIENITEVDVESKEAIERIKKANLGIVLSSE